MLWVFARAAFLFLARLVVPPPVRYPEAFIDPDEKCPACGNRKGSLKCVLNGADPVIQHSCEVCAAKWLSPLISEAKDKVLPA